MTVHSEEWSFFVKFLYKLVRPYLVKIVEDSSNKADDLVLKAADKLAGRKTN